MLYVTREQRKFGSAFKEFQILETMQNRNLTYPKYITFLFLLLLSTTQLSAQVSGIVLDSETSEPLPGVNILVKGTLTGTSTNIDGFYEIRNVSSTDTLIFSFLGFQTTVIPVNGRSTIDLNMLVQVYESGEEVIVVGYGTVTKENLTGSVSTVQLDRVKDIPANSVEGLLQGRAAGLQVISSSQDPGAGSIVRIRGGSSLRGSNSPLVVVDGFPLGDAGNLKQINPEDIVSVEILKDASSSAIYGSRGANGVLVVTTRKAKTGTTNFSVKQQVILSQFTSKLNLWRDPVLMAQLNNESRINGGFQPLYIGQTNATGVYFPSIEELDSGSWPHFTRWDDLVFRDPISNNTTVSVSSSNDKTNFTLSGNYYTNQGVYIQDDYEKLGYNFNVDHKLLPNLRLRLGNILSRGNRDVNGGLAYWRNPIYPSLQDDGSFYLIGPTDYGHPIAITEKQDNINTTTDVIAFIEGEWEIAKPLLLTSRFNYKYGQSNTNSFFPSIYTQTGDFNNGAAYKNDELFKTLVSETFVNYKDTYQEHSFGLTTGFSYQTDEYSSSNLGAFDFVNETLGFENLGAGNPTLNQVSNGFNESKLISGIFRANYEYKDTYLLTITARADGSSKFGKNNKWATFPSGAVSWKAHQEDFIKSLNLFDQLKFRVSYGISGNQGISPYQTLSRYGLSNYFNNGNFVTAIGPGFEVGRAGQGGIEILWGGIPNPDLKWETTAQSNFGVDMALLDDKVEIILDFYDKLTSDLLRERILAPSSGYDRMWVNDGEIRNRGVELTINSKLYSSKNLFLNSSLIYYRNRNEVVKLGNNIESGLLTDPNTGMEFEFWGTSIEQFRQYPNILAVGQPVNVFYGYKTDGIVQNVREGVASGLEGDLALPGEYKYRDINGDNFIDENDLTIIGDPNPDFMMSLGFDLTYKNFDFSIFFNGVFGNDVLNTQAFNQPSQVPLRWTADNPTDEYPSLRDGRQIKLSDWWIEDGSYLRIQNLNIGYRFTLPRNSGLRIFMNTSNLYTFSSFDGYDPEVGTNGIYWGGYPRFRQIAFGANFTF